LTDNKAGLAYRPT